MSELRGKMGHAIKKARWSRMMKQKDLAQKTGLTSSFLSEVESGKKSPSCENIEKICSALNVSFQFSFELLPEICVRRPARTPTPSLGVKRKVGGG